jgi:hypothetical protein
VHGITIDENIDPDINSVVEQKLAALPRGEQYIKTIQDMNLLSTIAGEFDSKTKKWLRPLTKKELTFLYEIYLPIDGFGWSFISRFIDPRIKKLREQRDAKADAAIIFDCQPDQIAWGKDEIREDTKAYVGPLFPDIFQILKHLKHIYTSFPEGRIVKSTIEIGGKTKEDLENEMKKQNIFIANEAKFVMDGKDFITSKKPEPMNLVKLTIKDLGLDKYITIEQIEQKAQKFGLELCPAEAGPYYRIDYPNQPDDEVVCMGMKPILALDGAPDIFKLNKFFGTFQQLDCCRNSLNPNYSNKNKTINLSPRFKIVLRVSANNSL